MLSYWCAIASLYRSLNAEEVLPNPYRRLATPLLAVVLYPTFNPETASWLEDFERRAAGLLIDHLLATPAPESDWISFPRRTKRLEAILGQQSGR
jgi:hypothetical protein